MMETRQEQIRCPVCGSSSGIDKIAKLYIEALSLLGYPKNSPPETLSRHFGERLLPESRMERVGRLREIIRLVAPPEGRKTVTRIVHPDAAVAGFLIIALLPLYGMYSGASSQLPAAAAILLFSLLAYILARKKILLRHRRKIDAELASREAVRLGIETWMRLHRCAEDGTVFDPQSGRRFQDGPLAAQLLGPNGARG